MWASLEVCSNVHLWLYFSSVQAGRCSTDSFCIPCIPRRLWAFLWQSALPLGQSWISNVSIFLLQGLLTWGGLVNKNEEGEIVPGYLQKLTMRKTLRCWSVSEKEQQSWWGAGAPGWWGAATGGCWAWRGGGSGGTLWLSTTTWQEAAGGGGRSPLPGNKQ